MKTCMVCNGAQNIASFQYGLRYHDCPACKHWGVRFDKIENTPEEKERYNQ